MPKETEQRVQSADLPAILPGKAPELLPEERVRECGEGFVRLTDDDRFHIDLRYAAQGIRGAVTECLIRETVAERLAAAQAMLPAGYRLRIFDAWRPFAVQQALYDEFAARVRAAHPKLQGEALRREIRQFVSEPQKSKTAYPVHCSGGAVDVTVERPDGTPLDMGTEFDCFEKTAYTAYFEGSGETEIIRNRRLLCRVMTAAGFVNLPSEWWHFDSGDRFWAYYTAETCIYEAVYALP